MIEKKNSSETESTSATETQSLVSGTLRPRTLRTSRSRVARTLSGAGLGHDAVLQHGVERLPRVLRQLVSLLAADADGGRGREPAHLLRRQHL